MKSPDKGVLLPGASYLNVFDPMDGGANHQERFDRDVPSGEIHRAEQDLYPAATNAAFLLYEDRGTKDEAEAYLREWALESDERAARSVAYISDPFSRAYIPAYQEGRRLCRGFADGGPGNFTRLLTEQLTIADLRGR